MPELPEVETVRRGLAAYVVGRRIDRREFHGPAWCDGTCPARPTSPPGWWVAGRPGPPARQVPLAGAPGAGRARPGAADAPGDERPAAGPAAGGRGREAPARPVRVRRRRDRAAVRRPADLRRRGLRRARRPRASRSRSPTSPRPARGGVGRGRGRRADEGAAAAGSSVPARPVAGQRDRQHLRRRGVVAGRDSTASAPRTGSPSPAPPAARPRPRGHGGGARPGRDELRRALRQRQRVVGVLRPVAGRLRAGGPAVPPLRDADPARGVHEPLVVLMPAVSAAAPGHEAHDVRRSRRGQVLRHGGERPAGVAGVDRVLGLHQHDADVALRDRPVLDALRDDVSCPGRADVLLSSRRRAAG